MWTLLDICANVLAMANHHGNIKHGYARVRTEGRKRSEYKIWLAMVRRCTKPQDTAFDRYGGRGITVCDRWRHGEDGLSGFQCFIADMGDKPAPGLTLERVNNLGHYEPANCIWATLARQARNKRNTRMVEWQGKAMPLLDLCEQFGQPIFRIAQRLEKLGWSLEKALMTPALMPDNLEQVRPSSFKPTFTVDWNGEKVPFIRLCEQFGIPYTTAIQRVRVLGWSTEKALTTPVRKR